MRELDRHVNVYVDDELYVEQDDKWARQYAEYAEVGMNVVPDLLAVVAKPPTKIVISSEPSDVAVLLPTLQERWRDSLYVTRSLPHFIEVSDPLASKSSALAYLCDALGLARERTVACGDGWNDIDMMQWAGLGVAVAEAADDVRAERRPGRAARRARRALCEARRGAARLATTRAQRPTCSTTKPGADERSGGLRQSEGGARRVRRRLLGVLVAPVLARRLPRAGDLDTLSPRSVQHARCGGRVHATHRPRISVPERSNLTQRATKEAGGVALRPRPPRPPRPGRCRPWRAQSVLRLAHVDLAGRGGADVLVGTSPDRLVGLRGGAELDGGAEDALAVGVHVDRHAWAKGLVALPAYSETRVRFESSASMMPTSLTLWCLATTGTAGRRRM